MYDFDGFRVERKVERTGMPPFHFRPAPFLLRSLERTVPFLRSTKIKPGPYCQGRHNGPGCVISLFGFCGYGQPGIESDLVGLYDVPFRVDIPRNGLALSAADEAFDMLDPVRVDQVADVRT